MHRLESVSISNMRCFEEKQNVELGKITLLVGENSAGKSTLLACCKVVSTLASFHELSDPRPPQTPHLFDLPPFHLGNFRNIARCTDVPFSLSASFGGRRQAKIDLTYGEGHSGVPTEKELAINVAAEPEIGRLVVRPDRANGEVWLTHEKFSISVPAASFSYREPSTWLSRSVKRGGPLPFNASRDDQIVRLGNALKSLGAKVLNERADIRHVAPSPRVMRRLRSYASPPLAPWDDGLRRKVATSANRLGVFDDVELQEIRGSSILSVKRHGGWFNIQDVGYGVASLLPLLHQIHVGTGNEIFFLQQPEVHVHPSAQAELAELIAQSPGQFIIETHSDHFLDRFLICVMEHRLQPEELKIAYLESDEGGRTTIYGLDIDAQGNLAGVPASYRRFFLDEASRLVGFR